MVFGTASGGSVSDSYLNTADWYNYVQSGASGYISGPTGHLPTNGITIVAFGSTCTVPSASISNGS